MSPPPPVPPQQAAGAGSAASAASSVTSATSAADPVPDLWPGPPQGHAAFPGTEMLRPSEVFAGPGYQAPQPRTDPVAALALGCALLSLVPGAGALALGLGLWAARRLRTRFATGASLARLAVVVGAAATVAWVWLGALLLLPV